MTATIPEEQDTELAAARWDLEPLVEGRGKEGALAQLDKAQELAEAFAGRHRGKVAELDAPGLAAALRELEEVYDLVGRAGSYASLWFTVDTDDPERGALLQAGAGARRGHRDDAALLRPRVERGRRRPRGGR